MQLTRLVDVIARRKSKAVMEFDIISAMDDGCVNTWHDI
jgi:hypothetical protein